MRLVKEGVVTLLSAQQFQSGTDLALLFVGKLKEDKTPITPDVLGSIERIHGLYGQESKCREVFMKAAIKWSSLANDELTQGHPLLHRLQARAYWQEQNFPQAKRHFLYANDFEEYGKMLVECATEHAKREECEFFLAQAVLQLLVLNNIFGARSVYLVYTGRHPHFQGEPPPYRNAPLANYIWFLLELIETSRDVEVLACLNDIYSKLLDCDPQYRKYLCQIGHLYFGIPSHDKPAQPTNLLEGIFNAMTGEDGGQNTGSGGLGGLLQSMGSAFQGMNTGSTSTGGGETEPNTHVEVAESVELD